MLIILSLFSPQELGLPDEVCEAALYLVARLTWSLANTFGVELPHPLRFPAGKPYALVMEDGKGRYVEGGMGWMDRGRVRGAPPSYFTAS
jgi:hypothetical protein